MSITIRYFAGARATAGVPSETVDLVPDGTVEDVLRTVRERHGEALTRVLAASSLLLDEVAVRDRSTRLRPGAVLDVLPPFAGG